MLISLPVAVVCQEQPDLHVVFPVLSSVLFCSVPAAVHPAGASFCGIAVIYPSLFAWTAGTASLSLLYLLLQ